jgi:transcriptional regulator with XRE-family HTH domain
MAQTSRQRLTPIARALRELREARGLTQREICAAIWQAPERQTLWSRWERGLVRPEMESLSRIAAWAGVSLEWLGVAAAGVEESGVWLAPADLARLADLHEEIRARTREVERILRAAGAGRG